MGNPQGELSLRTAIGAYLHSARGVNCSPDQILIGAGSEYLLMLLGQILGNDLGSDPRIAMENPTYKQAYRVLRGVGYSVVPVEMDRYGMNVDRLSHSGAQVAYIMPSHQISHRDRHAHQTADGAACLGRGGQGKIHCRG